MFWLRSSTTTNDPWNLQHPKYQLKTIDLNIAAMLNITIIKLNFTVILYQRTCQTNNGQQTFLWKLGFWIKLLLLTLPIVSSLPASPSSHFSSGEYQAFLRFLTMGFQKQ